MDPSRRGFFRSAGGAVLGGLAAIDGGSLPRVAAAATRLCDRPPEEVAGDEDFWAVVRSAYDPPDAPVNLMTGWYGSLPVAVRAAVVEAWGKTHDPEYHMWANGPYWSGVVDRAREGLARHVNCPVEEVAFTRNTTEAINTVLFGLDLEPGDEILTSDRDHAAFLGAMLQRAARDGIRARTVPLPVPAGDAGELVEALIGAIGPETRAILLCHVYSTGQVMPIARICEAAHAKGVRVIVDGALAFGHVETDLKEMGCDYYGASFHKFAGGPRGTGFLFVKKEHVGSLWPSCGSLNWTTRQSNHAIPEIGKLVAHGTDTTFLFAAVPAMLDFHEAVDPARRRARLFHLTRYWTDLIKESPGVSFTARIDPEHVCGLVGVTLEKVRPRELTLRLLRERELLVPYPRPDFNWVNTSLFTTTHDLDRLVDKLRRFARDGLPKSDQP